MCTSVPQSSHKEFTMPERFLLLLLQEWSSSLIYKYFWKKSSFECETYCPKICDDTYGNDSIPKPVPKQLLM